MWLLEQADAVAALPEIVLAVLTLALLMLGVFRKSDASDVVTLGALVALAITALLVIFAPDHQALAFHGAALVRAGAVGVAPAAGRTERCGGAGRAGTATGSSFGTR